MSGRINIDWTTSPWRYRATCTRCNWLAQSFRFNITRAQQDSRRHQGACS